MQTSIFYFRNQHPLSIVFSIFSVVLLASIVFGSRQSVADTSVADDIGMEIGIKVDTVTAIPMVLASIQPLALLAQEVAGEHGFVDVLLPGQASPHDYALSVSDRQSLVSADIVLWVGEALERFLSKPIRQRDKHVITAMALEGIQWPEESGSAHHHDGHDHGSQDPHLWLNPLNHLPIIDSLVAELSRLAPVYAPHYQRNGNVIKEELIALDQRLLRETQRANGTAFVVAHPAYTHFVARYQLSQLDYVASTPERRAGAKHLYRLRQLAEAECVFEDYGWSNAGAKQLAEELGVPLLSLNPFGVEEKRGDLIVAESASITQLIARLWDDFQRCGIAK
jgi:zinc transport system substrate-binding protein